MSIKPVLNLVKLTHIPIFQQLKWEESLLRLDKQNWCLLNFNSPPAIVMGISGQIDQLINKQKIEHFPLPLIRRFSGGGTVIVDSNTFFATFICQSTTFSLSPFPQQIMEWSAQFYRPLFPPALFQLRENDYVLGDHKFGGNAQSIVKGRWLHHSSLLWDYNSEMMEYLLLPSKRPAYRQDRCHNDFLCCLKTYWESLALFQEKLLEQIEKQFVIVERKKEDLLHLATSPHRQATKLISI